MNKLSHLFAILSIAVWGSSFVASKILLSSFSASKLILYRFAIGYLVMCLANHSPGHMSKKDELGMLVFGLFGITIYYLCETIALNYTYAANVSILVTFAPILTSVLAHFLTKDERITRRFLAGSAVSLVGVVMVVFNGAIVLKLSPAGDLLALGAALCWAIYSILLKYYTSKYDEFIVTRKVLFYGCLTLIPIAAADSSPWNLTAVFQLKNLLLFMFLGALSSGICYGAWNYANVRIGIIAANVYVYLTPFITLVTGALFLHEPVSVISIIGCLLIISGVILSKDHQLGIKNKQNTL